MRHYHFFSPAPLLLLIGGLSLTSVAYAEAEPTISGVVTDSQGQALRAVTVYGSMSKKCCPFRQQSATTDEKGQFRLKDPGVVIHFFKDEFQPQSLVLVPGSSEIRIALRPDAKTLALPSCGKPQAHETRVGSRLQFIVQKRILKILGGKPDVDYASYVIKPKKGEGYLELWFGPYAMNSDPDDDLFLGSESFEQRHVTSSGGTIIGLDSRGRLRSGGIWRQTAIIGQGGSRYSNVSPEIAKRFDQVVDSICETSDPP